MVSTGYNLVYQSGHGNTYCNGRQHVNADGGWTNEDVDHTEAVRKAFLWLEHEGRSPYACDCEYWKEQNKGGKT